jgi:hypothetical protein
MGAKWVEASFVAFPTKHELMSQKSRKRQLFRRICVAFARSQIGLWGGTVIAHSGADLLTTLKETP